MGLDDDIWCDASLHYICIIARSRCNNGPDSSVFLFPAGGRVDAMSRSTSLSLSRRCPCAAIACPDPSSKVCACRRHVSLFTHDSSTLYMCVYVYLLQPHSGGRGGCERDTRCCSHAVSLYLDHANSGAASIRDARSSLIVCLQYRHGHRHLFTLAARR